MRTTLDIDDDILQLAKELAAKEHSTAGAVLSELARQGFHTAKPAKTAKGRVRNGVRMLPRRNEPVTLAHVRALMDEEGV